MKYTDHVSNIMQLLVRRLLDAALKSGTRSQEPEEYLVLHPLSEELTETQTIAVIDNKDLVLTVH